MDVNSIPRSPGERPAWCQQHRPEDTGTDNTTGTAVFAWSRNFGTTAVGVDLIAEDHLTADGSAAGETLVYPYPTERGGMALNQAEQFALLVIEAVKVARKSESTR